VFLAQAPKLQALLARRRRRDAAPPPAAPPAAPVESAPAETTGTSR
jgi:galactofuranose transport system permease protein